MQKEHRDTRIVLLLKTFASSYRFFESVDVFHHKESMRLPFVLIAKNQGILLFETLDWDNETLKNATVSSRSPVSKEKSAVEIDAPLHLINQKFNEILHQDLQITTAFLIFNHLNEADFDRLDSSFHTLIPKSRALFYDETLETLTAKLHAVLETMQCELDETTLISTLFMQYTLLPSNNHPHLCIVDESQERYISESFKQRSTLIGPYGSGRSTAMALKVLRHYMKDPKDKILIIEPTHVACELLKHKMLEIIEYAIVDIDLSFIEVITPKELLLRHAKKIYGKPLEPVEITQKMMQKKFDIADIVIADDIELLSDKFLSYLLHIQDKKSVHYITANADKAIGDRYVLTHSYRNADALSDLCNKDLSNRYSYDNIFNIKLCEGNIYMQTILSFKEMLKEAKEGEKALIITPSHAFSAALFDEMHQFVEADIALFKADESIANQSFEHHLIVQQSDMASLQSRYVLLSGLNPQEKDLFCYALSRADVKAYVCFNGEAAYDINLELKEYF
jgi:hypothetical protein